MKIAIIQGCLICFINNPIVHNIIAFLHTENYFTTV